MEGRMRLRRKKGKRKTGFKLLLLVVLVMCGVLTYSTGKAKVEEQKLLREKENKETLLASEKEKQNELRKLIGGF